LCIEKITRYLLTYSMTTGSDFYWLLFQKRHGWDIGGGRTFSNIVSGLASFLSPFLFPPRRPDTQASHTATQVLSACSKIAQTLYTSRHDRMLRPIYHCLLNISAFSKKVTMESHGTNKVYHLQCLRMRRQRYTGTCPFTLKSHEKTEKISLLWLFMIKKPLLEGTVCQVDRILERFQEKQSTQSYAQT